MIKFKFKGIEVRATVEERLREYNDPRKGKQYRQSRHTEVFVEFWDYGIYQESFTQLAFIKSVLQYYMQCYWKRSTKQGAKIYLCKEIKQKDPAKGVIALHFAAKQKDNQYSLHISNTVNEELRREVYFDIQEVIMLHDAISKVFNLIGPVVEPFSEHEYISALNWGH